MQFDLFYEVSQPPLLRRSESGAYNELLAGIEYADELGFGGAWLVEHHFTRGYSHCSKPELLLAAAAQRTRRLRLGHAVIPLPLHHPVHVAERVATLDILSGGRLEVGIGRGFSPLEYDIFGAAMGQSRELTDEALEILRLSFDKKPITYEGRHYRLHELDLLPHVVQSPHPPLWTAAVSPDTYLWAARQKLGVLAGPFKPWFMVKHDIEHYRAAWHDSTAPRIGMTIGILCLEDAARARALAKEAFAWFYGELYKTTLPVLEKLYPSYEQIHELGRFRRLMKLGVTLGLLDTFGLAVVGTPDECVEKLAKYQAAGVTHLLCAIGAGAVDADTTRETLDHLARFVLPAFREAPALRASPPVIQPGLDP
jgi:alkanesulfonate monooxygenase SsuD/methylene tetrahydromethanopterin reductase-like flavin-dependent oxidoreductase (luciferase family)